MHPHATPLAHAAEARAAPSQITPPEVPKASPKGGEPCATGATDGVSTVPHGRNLLERVRWVQTAIDNGLTPADEVLLQHARDLTQLMEQAWQEYLDTRNEFALERARKHLAQRDAARRLLSAEWKRGREAEILAACSAGYFIDAGDAAREAVAANEVGAG